jgi:putative glutamine amidotransferase
MEKRPVIASVWADAAEGAFEALGADTVVVYDETDAAVALELADGILLTGGSDIDPELYGDGHRDSSVYGTDHKRDALELNMVLKARELGLPIMGICRGAQMLNVAHGGTLNQDINGRTQKFHWGSQLFSVLDKRSQLCKAIGTRAVEASHMHHQSVLRVGEGLLPIAWAKDGIIEAIESARGNGPYILGVQFHPEYDWKKNQDSFAIFAHFVREVRKTMKPGVMDAELRVSEYYKQTRHTQYDYRTPVRITSMLYGSHEFMDWDLDMGTRWRKETECYCKELNGSLCDICWWAKREFYDSLTDAELMKEEELDE